MASHPEPETERLTTVRRAKLEEMAGREFDALARVFHAAFHVAIDGSDATDRVNEILRPKPGSR